MRNVFGVRRTVRKRAKYYNGYGAGADYPIQVERYYDCEMLEERRGEEHKHTHIHTNKPRAYDYQGGGR